MYIIGLIQVMSRSGLHGFPKHPSKKSLKPQGFQGLNAGFLYLFVLLADAPLCHCKTGTP